MKGLAALAGAVARQGFPAIGTALGGPVGGAVAAEIARRIAPGETDPDRFPEVIAQALAAGDPEVLVELRRIEAEREAAQLEHAQQLARLEIADVQDARDNARDDRVRRILAPLFILMPVGILAMILCVQPAAELLSAAVLVLGLTIANAERVGNFFFGTSLGSKKKQEDIAGVLRR